MCCSASFSFCVSKTIVIRMLGEDGYGYELARKLESNGIWRSWLGDADDDYEALHAHLASPSSWSAFMTSSRISLQLRVRALLFDKASLLSDSSLRLGEPASDSSYLQMHADNVYFSLEQDIQDWKQLQAEGSPAMASLQAKFGLDITVACSSTENLRESSYDMESKHAKPAKTQNAKRSVSSPYADRPDAMLSCSSLRLLAADAGDGNGKSESREESELWYDQWLAKHLLERMQRLAWRTAQQRLPFKERETCLRTPHGMASYLACMEKVQQSRCIIKSNVKNLTERGPNTTDEDIEFFPEVMFPWNCVPDIPNFLNKGSHSDQNDLCLGRNVERLQMTPNQGCSTLSNIGQSSCIIGSEGLSPTMKRLDAMHEASGKLRTIGRRKEIVEEVAYHSIKELVARIIAGYGFQGLKQSALEILAQLATCYIRKLGGILRTLLDNYRNQYSQKDLLKMFIHNSGCSDLTALMEYVKAGIRQSAQQQSLLRNNQMQQLPLQIQFQQVQQDSKLLPQQMALQTQNLMIQQQLNRRQALLSRASQHVPLSAQQQQTAWQQKQQQQQLMQLAQAHHPPAMQQFKQFPSMQLSTFQPLSVPSSKPHVKVEALHELIGTDGTGKQETEDDREGIIASPSKRKR